MSRARKPTYKPGSRVMVSWGLTEAAASVVDVIRSPRGWLVTVELDHDPDEPADRVSVSADSVRAA